MTLEQIGETYRVPVKRDSCGDYVIPGKNGHLYTDRGKVFACFTDDGRKRPFPTKLFKTKRMQKLPGIKLKQEGDYEFLGEIPENLIEVALFEVLHVRRFKVTKGQPRPVPESFRRPRVKSATDAEEPG